MDASGAEIMPEVTKNPLLCPMCHDYFSEPCLLQCYHTFCGRCLRGREQEGRIVCPLCGACGYIQSSSSHRSLSVHTVHPSVENMILRQYTALKDGSVLPPSDLLMSQLLEIVNSENPPCANCDKRDRSNMHYCNTCGQALCSHCRDNTHRAKMFASHEIMHMSKCIREPRRCPQHGEQYIMYSPVQHSMLCVNCFRDTPSEIRAQCVDMDTAHAQAAKRLERGQAAILDLQSSVRDGLIALKTLLDELRRNMDSEKHTINTFCQGMQEAMAKTHAAMIMEVQRQFESKERTFRAQLVALGTVMPVLQLHLVLCATFTNAANKYQFLELCPAILERLANVGQLSQPVRPLQSALIRTNYRSEFAQSLEPWVGRTIGGEQGNTQTASTRVYETAEQHKKQSGTSAKSPKILDGEGPFASHCRTFEATLRELSQQLCGVKERVGDLHRDITALRKAQMPPLTMRYECVSRDCAVLDENLERQQQELERLAGIFTTSWEEQLWRLRVEQEVFNCQRADILTLRNELKHLSTVALQLEPYIKSITQPATDDQTQQHLQSLLEHIGLLQSNEGKLPRSRSRILGQLIEKVRPSSGESRERSKSVGQTENTKSQLVQKKKQPLSCQQSYSQQQQQQIERLETHLKEKIHDIMCRRQSKIDHTQESSISDDRKLSKSDLEQITKMGSKARHHKKMGKSCDKINTCSKLSEMTNDKKKCASESEYQRISEATSQSVKAIVHKESKSSPSSPKCKNKRKPKVYPYSDGEDNVFYNRHDSVDSLSTVSVNSRRSSLECPDKTLVVVIGARKKPLTLAQKQRSWETFPPKRRHHICKAATLPASTPLRKTDSFEGHEEAVKTLVAAVQETRRKPKSSN